MLSFNLFRRRHRPDLYCAVPEDLAVPGFIAAERWEFGGRVDAGHAPLGFDIRAAQTGARFNGFYVFQAA